MDEHVIMWGDASVPKEVEGIVEDKSKDLDGGVMEPQGPIGQLVVEVVGATIACIVEYVGNVIASQVPSSQKKKGGEGGEGDETEVVINERSTMTIYFFF